MLEWSFAWAGLFSVITAVARILLFVWVVIFFSTCYLVPLSCKMCVYISIFVASLSLPGLFVQNQTI